MNAADKCNGNIRALLNHRDATWFEIRYNTKHFRLYVAGESIDANNNNYCHNFPRVDYRTNELSVLT